jgi:hypothetical protein
MLVELKKRSWRELKAMNSAHGNEKEKLKGTKGHE